MKVNRTITREKAMTVLYQLFLYQKNKINYTISEVINEIIDDMDIEDIDIYISKYLENWSIERLGLTDQAIIRIATYELIYTDTPDLVCINEAIELAKKYSDEKVVKMINGVLDKIYHEREDNE